MGQHSGEEGPTAAASLGALLPAGLLGLFATCSGSFSAGAGAWPTLVGWLALFLVAGFGVERWRDPLRLGPLGPLPWLGWLLLAASLAASPVPRAGSTALLLFPIVLLVPAGVARLWRTPGLVRAGVRAISAVLLLVALWSIIDRFRWGADRAAMPLGHHNLLALWLVTMLPLAVLPLFEGPRGGRWRLLGLVGLVVGTCSLVLTKSLAGAAGLSLEISALVLLLGARAVAASRARRRWGIVLAGMAVALLGVAQAPRALSILGGADSSYQARLSYWRGGIDGWQQRPWFGWGPGASSWLAAEHVQPDGASPAHQIVTDLHSVPIELLFEVGLIGALFVAVILVAFVVCRVWESKDSLSAYSSSGHSLSWPLSLAGLMALLGLLLSLAGSGLFDNVALVVAGAVLIGALLAGTGKAWGHSTSLPSLLVLLLVIAFLVPRWRAHWHYERALLLAAAAPAVQEQALADASSARTRVRRHLRASVRLDPDFPLYRFRLAGLLGASDARVEHSRAAWLGRGLAALWLAAGVGSDPAPDLRTSQALERACDLDPLGGIAPFQLIRSGTSAALDRQRLARVLVAEPRLAAAEYWRDRPQDLAAAAEWLVAVPAIDAGWRVELRDRIGKLLEQKELPWTSTNLILQVDAAGETSISLFAFRRPRLEQTLVRIPLIAERLELITGLPPAFDAPGSVHDLLVPGCRFGS